MHDIGVEKMATDQDFHSSEVIQMRMKSYYFVFKSSDKNTNILEVIEACSFPLIG